MKPASFSQVAGLDAADLRAAIDGLFDGAQADIVASLQKTNSMTDKYIAEYSRLEDSLDLIERGLKDCEEKAMRLLEAGERIKDQERRAECRVQNLRRLEQQLKGRL